MDIDEIVAGLQAIVDGAENRDLTDEEATQYGALEGQLEIARRSTELRARQAAYTTPHPALAVATADEGDEQTRAFAHYLRTGQVDTSLVEHRAQTEGVPSQGGYLVPDGFRQKIVDRMVAFGGLANHVETLSTASGNPLEWPTSDDTANSGELVAEGGTFASGADLVFGTKTLGAYKYASGGASALPLKVSLELLQDSAFSVEDFIAKAFGKRLARIQAIHWIRGTGVGQPEGIVTPKTPFANIVSTTTPTYGELVDTVHALDPDYRAGSKWLFNDATLAVIRKMVDTANRPLLDLSTASIAGALQGGTLLGYPVVIDQGMASIAASGATKAILFGQLDEAYVIRRVKAMTMVVLHELYAPNGQVGFMAWDRADGAVQDPNAYVILASKA